MLVDIDPTVQQWLFLATLSDFVTDSTLLIKIAPTTDRDWLTALLQYSSCNTGNPSHVTCSDVGWLSSLVFYVPVNTIYVIWETNFYKSKDPTDSIKVLKEKTTKEKKQKTQTTKQSPSYSGCLYLQAKGAEHLCTVSYTDIKQGWAEKTYVFLQKNTSQILD